jgi:hypothetical protein
MVWPQFVSIEKEKEKNCLPHRAGKTLLKPLVRAITGISSTRQWNKVIGMSMMLKRYPGREKAANFFFEAEST